MAQRPVLLIEDDQDFSLAIGVRLQHYGIHVSTAPCGTQGFWKALCERPAVILSDLSMPDGDGRYLLDKVKTHPLTRDIPFIVITGHQERGLERHLLASGAVAYLRKPLVLAELLDALRPHVPISAPLEYLAVHGAIS